MANIFQFANLARSSLAGSITNTDVTMNVQSGGGAQFPTPSSGFQFALTLTDAATGLLKEIVYVTARSGDTMTSMVRGREGTTALNWAAGSPCANLWTAGQAAAMLQIGQSQRQGENYTVDSGVVNAYVGVYSPAITSKTAGMPLRLKVANTNTGPSTFNDGSGIDNIVLGSGAPLAGGEMVQDMISELMWNGTDYELMAPNISSDSILSGQCYLTFVSATQIRLMPLNGNRVPVQGSLIALPVAGQNVANTSIVVNGSAGSNLANDTDYLVALNTSGTLEFWTLATGYSISNVAGNVGVTVVTGHDDKTVVGMIGSSATGQFTSNMLLSWFNQKPKRTRTNFTGNPTTASTAPVELSSTIRNIFLTWASNPVQFSNAGSVEQQSSGVQAMTGIGFDSATLEQEAALFTGMHTNTEGSSPFGMSNFNGVKTGLTDGRHYATLVGNTTNAASPSTWQGGSTPFSATDHTPNVLSITVLG